MESVRLTGLKKCFGDFWAVKGVDLTVNEGEFFGLLGPNGAGKSTTIKMLTGLLRPTAGKASVCGFDVVERPIEVKSRIGLLPEDLNLYERLSGEEFVHFAGRMYSLDEETVRTRTAELFELLELTEQKDKLIIDYSFGMKKKVGLAAALIHRPKVIFLDEPFNGIDVISMRSVRRVLRELTGRGITIFFSSHVMEVVEKLCNRIAIMHKGEIAAVGTIEQLREQMIHHPEAELEDIFLHFVGERGEARRLSWIT